MKYINWNVIHTFCDILLSTTVQCINPLNLVMVLGQRHIFLRPHPMRHEHDIVNQAPYPNPMWLCIVANSGWKKKKKNIKQTKWLFQCVNFIIKWDYFVTNIFANDCNAHSHFSERFFFSSFSFPINVIRVKCIKPKMLLLIILFLSKVWHINTTFIQNNNCQHSFDSTVNVKQMVEQIKITPNTIRIHKHTKEIERN